MVQVIQLVQHHSIIADLPTLRSCCLLCVEDGLRGKGIVHPYNMLDHGVADVY